MGATGGPVALSQEEFYEGINDVLSPGFSPIIFTEYAAWEDLLSSGKLNRGQASVARGEILFNTKQFTINGVNGLNLFASDPLGANPIVGTCGTCHDSPNVGNHSLKLAIDIGSPGRESARTRHFRVAALHGHLHRCQPAPRRVYV